ncbi:MAG: hypothetical protein GX547_05105 [Phycisphaerae bacterium]|jgi:hypothetical protein|nr:hypothetical protein [Phycisphaerae bacterium]
MRYVAAILVCALEGLVYAVIGGLLGWERGGGLLPKMVLFAVWGATWHALARSGRRNAHLGEADPYLSEQNDNPKTSECTSERNRSNGV